MPNNASKSINHGIDNLDRFIDIQVICGRDPLDPNKITFKLNFINNNGDRVYCTATTTQVTIAANTNRSSTMAYIILSYTKTS